MEWLGLLLENPQNNLTLLVILAMAFSNVMAYVYKIISGVFKTVDGENILQSRLIDEIAARRKSDDAIKHKLLAHQEKHLTKIDLTTRDTNRNSYRIKKDIRQVKQGLKAMYIELKEKGIL